MQISKAFCAPTQSKNNPILKDPRVINAIPGGIFKLTKDSEWEVKRVVLGLQKYCFSLLGFNRARFHDHCTGRDEDVFLVLVL
jgi:hypothetical protein